MKRISHYDSEKFIAKLKMEDQIIQAIQSGIHGTLDLSKRVFGKDGTKAMINPVLYRMASSGKIRHIQTGNVHLWFLPETSR